MPTVYVLRCAGGKFYVGFTTDLAARVEEHASGDGGSEWTRQHKPLELVETHSVADEEQGKALEKQLTLEHMMQYGVNNVRGAGYTQTREYVSSGLDRFARNYAEFFGEDIEDVHDRFASQLPLHYPAEFESPAQAGGRPDDEDVIVIGDSSSSDPIVIGDSSSSGGDADEEAGSADESDESGEESEDASADDIHDDDAGGVSVSEHADYGGGAGGDYYESDGDDGGGYGGGYAAAAWGGDDGGYDDEF
jgi:putative endonuclease